MVPPPPIGQGLGLNTFSTWWHVDLSQHESRRECWCLLLSPLSRRQSADEPFFNTGCMLRHDQHHGQFSMLTLFNIRVMANWYLKFSVGLLKINKNTVIESWNKFSLDVTFLSFEADLQKKRNKYKVYVQTETKLYYEKLTLGIEEQNQPRP